MPDPTPVSVDTPNVLELQFIVVTVRTDFLWRKSDGSVDFHWSDYEIIVGATVELLGTAGGSVTDSALTDSQGQAALETSLVPDGDYIVRITPKEFRNELAGPKIAETDTVLPARMYHPLDVAVKLSQGLIEKAAIDPKVKYASLGNRKQSKWPPDALPTDHLPIDLKPIWMKATRAATAGTRAIDQIQLFVIHNTGADSVAVATIGPDINTFLPPGKAEIHYLMDLNGHVIKFMRDRTTAWHADGKWKGLSTNDISIGIEVVHKEKGDHEYTDDQYEALLDFIDRLFKAYPIDKTQITGHSDVGTRIPDVAARQGKATDLDLLDGDRDQDPGQIFRWEKLEEKGWGMIPQSVTLGAAYGDLFSSAEKVVLATNDHDAIAAHPPHKAQPGHFGGKDRPDTPGNPIFEVQSDLAQIGYSVKANGTYDQYTERAVAAFQRHFFSGTRRRKADGKVDKETAQMLKNVIGTP